MIVATLVACALIHTAFAIVADPFTGGPELPAKQCKYTMPNVSSLL